MKIHFFLVLLYTLIGVVFSSSSYSKNTDFNYNAKNLSGYFSALISFNDFDYLDEDIRFFLIILNKLPILQLHYLDN